MRSLVVLMAAALCAGFALAAPAKKPKEPPPPVDLVGTVSRVVDGDTFWLKLADAPDPVVVRIEGIDAPESCQAWGKEATAALTEKLLNRQVSVKPVARDEHARVIGRVRDGTVDVGDRLVRDGHAWSSRYKYDRGPYVAEERMAQSLKRGLHADGAAVQPRLFRERNAPCAGAPASQAPAAPIQPVVAPSPSITTASAMRCDGRQYCSQMTSCAEAKWFLKNCPGMKMDGNNDGVPCEQQWCKAAR
jgi:endonuclease YncB( thermonuclease family)